MDNHIRKLILGATALVILTTLNIAVYLNGISYSCDNCIVRFNQFEQSGMKLPEPIVHSIPATELYNSLLENKCLVTWDYTDGYRIHEIR